MRDELQIQIGNKQKATQPFLWEASLQPALFEKCEQLFQTYFGSAVYPKQQVEQKLTLLTNAVEVQRQIHVFPLTENFNWIQFLETLREKFPQIVWTGICNHPASQEWIFTFVPVVVKTTSFPFELNLAESLVQQKIAGASHPLDEWQEQIVRLLKNQDGVLVEPKKGQSNVQDFTKDKTSQAETSANSAKHVSANDGRTKHWQAKQQFVAAEYDVLKERVKDLESVNKDLEDELERVQTESLKYLKEVTEKNSGLEQNEVEKQALYYEEALRRERNAKERMRLSKEKLEHLVSRLERQVMTTGLTILEKDFPYVHRAKDWHRKLVVPLPEYDQLYQKAKYLEHTWHVNQQLELTNEKMIVNEAELLYERERLKKVKNSAKDIELFVMMDECRLIHERAKIKHGFLWMRPRVILLKEDYENLVEKAAYYDVIQSENQLLERLIEERKGYRERKVVK